MNRLTIIGNLTRDPELRSVNTANGPVSVCDFTVAVNRRNSGSSGQNDADFFRVTAWRGLGENCKKFLTKGRKVAVEGPVSCRTYTGNDGVTRASLEVNADEVEFLSPRPDGQAGQSYQAAAPAPAPAPEPQQMDYQMVVDDDLPF